MYCGKKIPDDVIYCIFCGENQNSDGTGSSDITYSSSNDNTTEALLEKRMVPATCPNCGGQMSVDPEEENAVCNYCGTVCLVSKAIETLKLKGDVNVSSAEIIYDSNIKGKLENIKVLLKFGEFETAKEKCELLIKEYPSDGYLYMYLLMIEYRCSSFESLCRLGLPIQGNMYYKKVDSLGESAARRKLFECNEIIKKSIENNKEEYDNFKKNYVERSISDSEVEIRNLSKVKKGTIFRYGVFENKPLYWLALEEDGTKIGALSFGLFEGYKSRKSITRKWENNSIRKYLNGEFITKSFSKEQQKRILESIVHTEPNPLHNANPGKDTVDRVYILSAEEVEKYSDEIYKATIEETWILRTPAEYNGYVTCVSGKGEVCLGSIENSSSMFTRPFMWIAK
ncbi:MAG: TFIIB-type zinc ribbon-containing protein [Lachnospiraceae bacterium]|nr:TFIIB-type zinc ribbon-containing protein [Lachnospiraceae bacterium]